jgi:gas vesicle protein GvpG
VFLIDTVLLSPIDGVVWVAEKIRDAAREQAVVDAESLTEELRCLYLELEGGRITEEQFAEHEQTLLDRLDALQADATENEDEDEDGELEQTDDEDADSDPEGTT